MPILFLYFQRTDGFTFSSNNKIATIENSGMKLCRDDCARNAIPQMKGRSNFINGNSLNKVNYTKSRN
jgi:hypothetical protein